MLKESEKFCKKQNTISKFEYKDYLELNHDLTLQSKTKTCSVIRTLISNMQKKNI